MENIINADYQVVQERTPEVIRTEIKTIEAQVYKTTLDGVIQIGTRLQEVKEMLGHGNWLPWCKENLGYSDRQAQRYIEISQEYGKENSGYLNTTISSDLSISKAYSLLSLPEEEVEKFAEENDVENMTVKKLESEIKKWKNRAASLDAYLEDVKEAHAKLQAQKEEKEAALAEKEETEAKIQVAITETEVSLRKEAEQAQAEKLKELEESKRAMEEQLAEAKKKLKLSNNTDITAIKVKLDLIQKTFMDIDIAIENIGLEDKEQETKLRSATRQILQSLIERLEGQQ